MSIASRMPLARSSSFGAGSFGDQEIQQDGKLFPSGIAVGQDRGQEIVGTAEYLGLAFEVDLPVFVELST